MMKRRLNQRQLERIKHIQQRRRDRANERSEAASSGPLGPEQAGLVTANYGSNVVVEDNHATLRRCMLRQNIDTVVCGDRVIWQALDGTGDEGIVVALDERRTLLMKADHSGQPKAVAANIDQVAVVISPRPIFNPALIDRYLVALEVLGIAPLIVLNKVDLVTPDELAELERELDCYRQIGYPLLHASCHTSAGLSQFRARLKGRSSVLVGQSGVGKSSLISSLLPDLEIRIQAISAATGLGTHTTTTAMLYHLPDGGDLIDSPGVRSFEPISVAADELESGFREFHPFAGLCRFSNCQHDVEPQCALIEAVQQGKIAARRLQSFHQMRNAMESRERSY